MHCPTLRDLPPPPPGKSGWPWTEESPRLPEPGPGGAPWPPVTVVTPSYNQGRFLEETIRSVLLQGYPSLEYIIVDGGSTDESVGVIRKYEPWLAYWVSERDRGQSHAINKGWSRATGEILAWLCSDDLYFPGAIAAGVAALSRRPHAAVVYSDCRYIDAESRPLLLRRPGSFDFERLLWHLSSYVPQPTTFIRRAVLEEVGFVDESLTYSMDYELWLRIGMRYPFHYEEAVWAATRMHEGAKTVGRHRESWEHKLKILCATLDAPDLPPRLREQAPSLYSAYYLTLARVCARQGDVRAALRSLGRAIALRPAVLFDWRSWRRFFSSVWRLVRDGARSTYMPAAAE